MRNVMPITRSQLRWLKQILTVPPDDLPYLDLNPTSPRPRKSVKGNPGTRGRIRKTLNTRKKVESRKLESQLQTTVQTIPIKHPRNNGILEAPHSEKRVGSRKFESQLQATLRSIPQKHPKINGILEAPNSGKRVESPKRIPELQEKIQSIPLEHPENNGILEAPNSEKRVESPKRKPEFQEKIQSIPLEHPKNNGILEAPNFKKRVGSRKFNSQQQAEAQPIPQKHPENNGIQKAPDSEKRVGSRKFNSQLQAEAQIIPLKHPENNGIQKAPDSEKRVGSRKFNSQLQAEAQLIPLEHPENSGIQKAPDSEKRVGSRKFNSQLQAEAQPIPLKHPANNGIQKASDSEKKVGSHKLNFQLQTELRVISPKNPEKNDENKDLNPDNTKDFRVQHGMILKSPNNNCPSPALSDSSNEVVRCPGGMCRVCQICKRCNSACSCDKDPTDWYLPVVTDPSQPSCSHWPVCYIYPPPRAQGQPRQLGNESVICISSTDEDSDGRDGFNRGGDLPQFIAEFSHDHQYVTIRQVFTRQQRSNIRGQDMEVNSNTDSDEDRMDIESLGERSYQTSLNGDYWAFRESYIRNRNENLGDIDIGAIENDAVHESTAHPLPNGNIDSKDYTKMQVDEELKSIRSSAYGNITSSDDTSSDDTSSDEPCSDANCQICEKDLLAAEKELIDTTPKEDTENEDLLKHGKDDGTTANTNGSDAEFNPKSNSEDYIIITVGENYIKIKKEDNSDGSESNDSDSQDYYMTKTPTHLDLIDLGIFYFENLLQQ